MKRRAFMKAAAGTALYGSGVKLFGQDAPSNTVRVAVMGCHTKGRGFSLARTLTKLPGVEVAVVVDVDARARAECADALEKLSQKKPRQEKDLRVVLQDKGVDAVVCAAPDHWHAPAALMTMQAGKAIYVEKPCSHNPREGEMLVEAAAKYKAVFQMGNQRRSSLVYQDAIKAIREGVIGDPRYVRCWYATRRAPIGKGQEVAVPEWLDWDLWQGPAPREKYRDNLVHYNWHWFFNWGTGECGNNATHFVDVGRWALDALYPERVTSAGGRLFHSDDDWQWFDTQMATFNFPGGKFMTWEGLSSVNGQTYESLSTGAMVYGLKGSVLFAPNNVCTIFDAKSKEVRKITSKDVTGDPTNRTDPTASLDVSHLGDWVRCIREKSLDTKTPATDAHASTLLTHLANIAQRTGETIKLDPATGKLASGSAGAKYWWREYAKGWKMKV